MVKLISDGSSISEKGTMKLDIFGYNRTRIKKLYETSKNHDF